MMKKITALVLTVLSLFIFAACGGASPIDLAEPIDLTENPVVSQELLARLADNAAIGVFEGGDDDYRYEWVIFGNDITDPRTVDLTVLFEPPSEDESNNDTLAAFTFAEKEPFGFSAVLSITLPEKGNCPTALVYRDGAVLCGASVTGVDTTVLNFSIGDPRGNFRVVAEYPTYADGIDGTPSGETNNTLGAGDEYLSESVSTPDALPIGGEPSGERVHDENATLSKPSDQTEKLEIDRYLSADRDEKSEVVGADGKNPTASTRPSTENPPKKNQSDGYLSDSKNESSAVYGKDGTNEKVEELSGNARPTTGDSYLSSAEASATTVVKRPSGGGGNRLLSDGKANEQDEYLTDPIPAGKPLPVEPEDSKVDKAVAYTCTISIECSTIFNNLSMLDENKRELLPSDGVLLAAQTATFYEGESVYDVLARVCRENGVHMEASFTPMYNSAYIEGIGNLYEFDCGNLSGWTYRVNGWYPNYGCSRYALCDGDTVEWRYTCDLGRDVGCDWLMSAS